MRFQFARTRLPPRKSEPANSFSLFEVRKSNRSSLKPAPSGFGQVAEDHVLARFAGQQQAAPLIAQRAVFVKGHASRRTAAIDVAGRHGAGIFLAPLRRRHVLSRTFVRAPRAFAIGGGKARVAAFQNGRHAAGGRIVVVALKQVAKRVDRLLEAVAIVVPDDLNVRAVGIHASA